MTPEEAHHMNMLHHGQVAIGEQLDRLAEHFGVPPRDVIFDGDPATTAPDGKRYLADDAFRKRILHKLRGLPGEGALMADLAKLAEVIERQFTDPSTPPRWDGFSDDDWRAIAKVLRLVPDLVSFEPAEECQECGTGRNPEWQALKALVKDKR